MNNELEVELQDEIDADRRAEFGLIPKALIALLVVGVLVAIRVVFFT
jgi:cell division protein FtsL